MVLLKRGINTLPFDGGRTVEEMRMEQPVSLMAASWRHTSSHPHDCFT